MKDEVDEMFSSDISFEEYFSLMNSEYEAIFSGIAYAGEYKTLFRCGEENEKCTIGEDITPVQLDGGSPYYTEEYYYKFAA